MERLCGLLNYLKVMKNCVPTCRKKSFGFIVLNNQIFLKQWNWGNCLQTDVHKHDIQSIQACILAMAFKASGCHICSLQFLIPQLNSPHSSAGCNKSKDLKDFCHVSFETGQLAFPWSAYDSFKDLVT